MEISVVIPVYNREKTIQNTLESVLTQTSLPLEIIVVDDCSADNTVEIVRNMKKKSALIRLICMKRNRGAQAARNIGIKAAKGEWIAFLDSDDEWTKDKLEIYKRAHKEHPEYDMYYSDYYEKKGKKLRYKKCSLPNKNGDYSESILFSSKIGFPTIVVRKQAMIEIDYLDEKVLAYQEWDTNIRLAQNHRFYYIDEPLFIYNIHEGETISKNKIKGIKGFQYVIKSNVDIYFKYDAYKTLKMYYAFLAMQYKDNEQKFIGNMYLFYARAIDILYENSKIWNINLFLHKLKWKKDIEVLNEAVN